MPTSHHLADTDARGPDISVCIPSYNYARFIGHAIESVLGQDHESFELIVCDDQSSDNTNDVVSCFKDPRLRYYRNESNLGAYGNDNRCISLARGRYICLLDADDVMLSGNLTSKAAVLDRFPDVGLVYSACKVIDGSGAYLWTRRSFNDDYVRSSREELSYLFFDNHLHFSSVMVRRDCYETMGLFDESFTHSGDYDMWLRIASRYDVAYLAAPLTASRIHGSNSTSRAIPDGRSEAESIAAIGKAFASLPADLGDLGALQPRATSETLLRCAAYYFALGDIEKGRLTTGRAIRECPSMANEPARVFGILLGAAVESLIADRLAHIRLVFKHLPTELASETGYQRKLESAVHMDAAFRAMRGGETETASSADLLRGLWLDPSWIGNRGVRARLGKLLLGDWLRWRHGSQ